MNRTTERPLSSSRPEEKRNTSWVLECRQCGHLTLVECEAINEKVRSLDITSGLSRLTLACENCGVKDMATSPVSYARKQEIIRKKEAFRKGLVSALLNWKVWLGGIIVLAFLKSVKLI